MDHRPLCLSPDIIWLMICQGVANHINVNADTLRNRFVRHEGKLRISVRRDDFTKGSPENPWAEAIEELTSQVEAHIGSQFGLFQAAFTTTGPVERAAAGVVLLDAMQSYFAYDVISLCGIPAIILEGTPEDWQTVAERAERFGSLDLEWWLEPLRDILHQFVAASQGSVDLPFWQSLYKYHDESGGPRITGWISALFPYLNDDRTGLAINRNSCLTSSADRAEDTDDGLDEDLEQIDIVEDDDDDLDETHLDELSNRKDNSGLQDELNDDWAEDSQYAFVAWLEPMPSRKPDRGDDDPGSGWDGPTLSSLPGGMSKAPFRWEYRDRSFDMEFLGGFVGVSQNKYTLAVKPEIGWAVREAPATG